MAPRRTSLFKALGKQLNKIGIKNPFKKQATKPSTPRKKLTTEEKIERAYEKSSQQDSINQRNYQAEQERKAKAEAEEAAKPMKDYQRMMDSIEIKTGQEQAEKIDFFSNRIKYDVKTEVKDISRNEKEQAEKNIDIEEMQNRLIENELELNSIQELIRNLEAENELTEQQKVSLLNYKQQEVVLKRVRNNLYKQAPMLRDPEEFINKKIQ